MAHKPDFDDNPEWTEDDFARARPASEVHGPEIAAAMVRKQGRPRLAEGERKQPVSLRLSADVLAALRVTGEGWQTRVDDMLRAALGLNPELGRTAEEVVDHFVDDDLSPWPKGTGTTLFERMAVVSGKSTLTRETRTVRVSELGKGSRARRRKPRKDRA